MGYSILFRFWATDLFPKNTSLDYGLKKKIFIRSRTLWFQIVVRFKSQVHRSSYRMTFYLLIKPLQISPYILPRSIGSHLRRQLLPINGCILDIPEKTNEMLWTTKFKCKIKIHFYTRQVDSSQTLRLNIESTLIKFKFIQNIGRTFCHNHFPNLLILVNIFMQTSP